MAKGIKQAKIAVLYFSSGEILYFRALQGHSGRNLINPSLQDNVVIFRVTSSRRFLEVHSSRWMCKRLHSIINSGLILGGQNLTKRQTAFFLLVDLMDQEHKDLDTIDLGAPRLAWYHQKKLKRHQHTVYGVDIRLLKRKD